MLINSLIPGTIKADFWSIWRSLNEGAEFGRRDEQFSEVFNDDLESRAFLWQLNAVYVHD